MLEERLPTVLDPRPLANFVETDEIRAIADRALVYIQAGFPVHFRGDAGTGKTTLALHVAAQLKRPVVLIHGDEEFSTADLIGGEYGYSSRRVIDNYIHSVLKSEEEVAPRWVDNRLTTAARNGFTLVYDEFTRSRPEANNVLLAVLQERILDMPAGAEDSNYLSVHPQFTSIFTSNSSDYAGVYGSQDALFDRMVTLDLQHYDFETEVAITQAKAGLTRAEAERIVSVTRSLRDVEGCEVTPSVRSCIKIGRAVKMQEASVSVSDPYFRAICQDVLGSGASRSGHGLASLRQAISSLVECHCQNAEELADVH